jgi:hypothetical protein
MQIAIIKTFLFNRLEIQLDDANNVQVPPL